MAGDNTPRWYPDVIHRLIAVYKSRSIRIAVNLCVIGALLMPSGGMQPAKAAKCNATASSEAVCEGCGHCRVSTPGERCGCCATAPPKQALKAGVRTAKGCCHQPTSASMQRQTKHSGNNRTKTSGACLCGSEPQPPAPIPNNRRVDEQLVKLLLAAPPLGFAAAACDPSDLTVEHYSAPPSHRPHDSQRRLCVWRI